MRRSVIAMQGNSNKAKFFYNDISKVVLPESHRFPMEKYRMVREGLQEYYEADKRVEFIPSPLASPSELKTTHCPKYVDRYITGQMTPLEIRRVGFPWSISNVQRSTSSVGGTVAAMRAVCEDECDVAGHCAGGTHHAFYDYGKHIRTRTHIHTHTYIHTHVHTTHVHTTHVIMLSIIRSGVSYDGKISYKSTNHKCFVISTPICD